MKTLNQTWTLCLRMWRWIAKTWIPGEGPGVVLLKEEWLNANGFENSPVWANCFFCEYQKNIGGCTYCPGRLIDPSFNCKTEAYYYRNEPVAFYKELLRLNRIRKKKGKS